VTTLLNLAKQQVKISVPTTSGESPTLERHESCGTPHSAHGYALLTPLCITKPLYQQRQYKEERNKKEVTELGQD